MSRDLPMPVPPERARPRLDRLPGTSAAAATRVSSSRPTSAVSPAYEERRSGSPGNSRAAPPGPHRPGDALEVLRPRSSSSKISPRSLRVPSAMTTTFGSASACRRAARFGVSPTTRLAPGRTAGHKSRPRRDQWRCRREPARERPRRSSASAPPPPAQARHARRARRHAHGPRIAKISQHPVGHIVRNETASLRDQIGAAVRGMCQRSQRALGVESVIHPRRAETVRRHRRGQVAPEAERLNLGASITMSPTTKSPLRHWRDHHRRAR